MKDTKRPRGRPRKSENERLITMCIMVSPTDKTRLEAIGRQVGGGPSAAVRFLARQRNMLVDTRAPYNVSEQQEQADSLNG